MSCPVDDSKYPFIRIHDEVLCVTPEQSSFFGHELMRVPIITRRSQYYDTKICRACYETTMSLCRVNDWYPILGCYTYFMIWVTTVRESPKNKNFFQSIKAHFEIDRDEFEDQEDYNWARVVRSRDIKRKYLGKDHDRGLGRIFHHLLKQSQIYGGFL